jgi:hypothetical protein
LTLQVVRPTEAAEALRTIARYIEQLEETTRRMKMPEIRLSDEELVKLDAAAREMDEKGMSLTLEEFNQRFNAEVQRNSTK